MAPLVLGGGLSPTGATLNGDFEHPRVPAPVLEQLEGNPYIDTCYGIGHQAPYWGSETIQGDLASGDVEGASERVLDEEQRNEQVSLLAGPDNCVWSSEEGYDLVWFAPMARMANALHWSFDPNNPGVTFGYFFDDDPFDREAKFRAGVGSNHNMWQAYPSPHQAFTANFDALVMDIEAGSIPPGAKVQVSLTTTPSEDVYDYPVIGLNCGLDFSGAALLQHIDANGHVAMPPTAAHFFARDGIDDGSTVDENDPCWDAAQAWTDADDEERRDILGRLRIVQVSFWAWNSGTVDVVVDNVNLAGATTIAEELARGNIDLDTVALNGLEE